MVNEGASVVVSKNGLGGEVDTVGEVGPGSLSGREIVVVVGFIVVVVISNVEVVSF